MGKYLIHYKERSIKDLTPFQEELDFIINYDIKYRMGKELNSGGDNNG